MTAAEITNYQRQMNSRDAYSRISARKRLLAAYCPARQPQEDAPATQSRIAHKSNITRSAYLARAVR
jgi:hypothetical protein